MSNTSDIILGAARSDSPEVAPLVSRDPLLRARYLGLALGQIPRLLGAVDRNRHHATYGCFDRQFWHYRTSAFPSEMYQEAVLPLALVYVTPLEGNRWYAQPRLRELALAALRFSAASSHADGSCDDYYPFERALGAAVFSLAAASRAYQLLELDDRAFAGWLTRRADWIAMHDESGRLANHHALAALGLWRVADITGIAAYRDAAQERIAGVLAWQSREGWFEEYGGADPGYQTVTIDALAKLRRLMGNATLDEPLRRAVAFARLFLHPDDSYGGEYGSRGTYHFYPHGCELLAGEQRAAAELADGFLRSIEAGTLASFDDDRMYAHRLGNLLEAYLDWSPTAPAADEGQPGLPQQATPFVHLVEAGLLVERAADSFTVISAARGGVFKHFRHQQPPLTDTGLVIETSDGRQAVSQMHDRARAATWQALGGGGTEHCAVLTVCGQLTWARHETPTPLKQALFHTAMCVVGRWCRELARRLLQKRLITGRRLCPVRLTRRFEFTNAEHASPTLRRVVDEIELLDDRLQVRRMSYTSDLQASYVAAANVYQASVLQSWIDLTPRVAELNLRRRLTIERTFGQDA